MKVVFVLPGSGELPIGGYKVVYEYAVGLVQRGHQVTVVHPATLARAPSPFQRVRSRLRYLRRRLNRAFGPAGWFPLHPEVEVLWVPSPAHRFIPKADAVVATAWETAEWVARYPADQGRKFYLIQHLETWAGPEEHVLATWKLPLRKIVISSWLEGIADSMNEDSVRIPNGLDFAAFGLDVPPGDRQRASVLMIHHDAPWKGSADGLAALTRVRATIPELDLHLFGVPDPPRELPHWVTYHRQPAPAALRALYNQAAVFVAPSHSEGWGLPPSEAMMCGCAVAATDIGGHREFCLDGETALLSPPEDPVLLAANVSRLLTDPDLRLALSTQGTANIQQFTWERAVERLLSVLEGNLP